ncbi:hypothetical protein M0812_29279 [Anaeramoeba flamelloides]|uniref:Uncharacterized protein n=1 Tax=Anaeramoeba flamelloides TaxID=1746091 RepID=A0AAV7Y7N0_9EUKA|nr:hypothetical protein M0812_29279 [Anaeramoeba flamelloides]
MLEGNVMMKFDLPSEKTLNTTKHNYTFSTKSNQLFFLFGVFLFLNKCICHFHDKMVALVSFGLQKKLRFNSELVLTVIIGYFKKRKIQKQEKKNLTQKKCKNFVFLRTIEISFFG